MVKRRNSGGARQPAQLEWWEKPMVTPKGTFQFTPVADGVYIEHNWNQNSGHIGIPKQNIGRFIKYLTALEAVINGATPSEAPGPARGIAKTRATPRGKEAAKVEQRRAPKKPKPEPTPKPTVEDLDADLTSYLSARSPAEAAAAAPADAS
mmetsp:Transcript_31236/g.68332  ORF Transcript_31236/g.68332 Transcript_31236/m.68332 type:complete len:151 (-) Transcript_31236:886-1338(-)